MIRVVIDTNIVLDLFVFDDAAAQPLRDALEAGEVEWLATDAMRVELARVLGYPHIAARMAQRQMVAAEVLAACDARVHQWVAASPPRAPCVCKDPDDQIFIDLAVAQRAQLLSKDREVLVLRKRLAQHDVDVQAVWAAP